LARVISSASASQSMRTSGTAAYMSPEQAMGKPLDHRTDVWSLGVVLAEMVTGCRPFGGENLTGMMWEILNKPPSSMDNLPPEVQPIVYRALAKDASQRYASCEEMLADLERVRKELPADAQPMRDVNVTASLRSAGLAEAVRNASQPSWTQSGTAVGQKRFRWRYVVVPVAVLALAACAPQACHEIYTAWKEKDPVLAQEKQERVLRASARVGGELGIPGLKFACDLNGYYGGPPRMPLLPLTGDVKAEVTEIMANNPN